MLEIVFLEQNNLSYFQQEYAYWRPFLFVKLFLTLILLIVGLIVLFLKTPEPLIGFLAGLGGSWLSIILYVFFNFLIVKFINNPKRRISLGYLVFFMCRFLIFIFLLVIFILLIKTPKKGVEYYLEPINIVYVILSYEMLPVTMLIGNFIKI